MTHDSDNNQQQAERSSTALLTWRSRLDEEWAIFFATLRPPFFYYPGEINFSAKKFALSAFWLPQQEVWMQAVLRKPAPGVAQQAMRLAEETDYDVALFFGAVAPTEDESAYLYSPISIHTGVVGSHLKWTECPQCGAVGLTVQGVLDQLHCYCAHTNGEIHRTAHQTPRLLEAYTQARAHRHAPFPVPYQEEVDYTDPLSIIAASKRKI